MKSNIIATQDVLFGKPRIKGSRIGVDQILAAIAEGYSFEEIQHDFPDITKEDIQACADYAKRLISNVHVFQIKPDNIEISKTIGDG